mgnify:CR=1 FL=1
MNDASGTGAQAEKETHAAETPQPQEQKVIDDAKAILMEKNNMTEPEAFRYIQKCSMDSGNTMVESASMVIGIYSE